MTLLDRPAELATDDGPEVPLWRPVAIGLATGAISLLPWVVLALLALWSDPRSSMGAGDAAGVGASLWLAAQGAGVHAGRADITVLPLLLAVLPVAIAAMGARRVVAESDLRDSWWAGLLPASLARGLGLWTAGYAAVTLLAVGLTFAGPTRPIWWRLPVPVLLVPVLAIAWAVWRAERAGRAQRADRASRVDSDDAPELLGPALSLAPIPVVWRRAWAPGLRAAGWLLLVGMVAVLVLVAFHLKGLTTVTSSLAPGLVGGTVLALLQVAALPNLGLWAVSVLTGPGASVVQGASITVSGASSGLMPLIPVYGALPQPGDFPMITRALLLIPVLIGLRLGRDALATVARLSSLRTKAAVALAASVVAASVLTLLDLIAGASLGAYRLSDIGAPAGWLFVAVLGELALGALLWVLWDAWRLRR